MATRKAVSEETKPGPVLAAAEPVSVTSVTLLDDSLEITYSRSWELAVVQYEKEVLFTSFKVRVPVDSDLTAVGEKCSDMMNEIQEADLGWARSMTNNNGSLITRIIK